QRIKQERNRKTSICLIVSFFVSVTQQFNMMTSMGRLTLNVFEREVAFGTRPAASKRLWVGGPLPLGYGLENGTIGIVERKAEHVRLFFRRYLEVICINELAQDLREKQEDFATPRSILRKDAPERLLILRWYTTRIVSRCMRSRLSRSRNRI